MRQQAEIENASLAESLPNLTWMFFLNKGMLSHEPKGEKSKTIGLLCLHEISTCVPNSSKLRGFELIPFG
jgi:hypothetical protein